MDISRQYQEMESFSESMLSKASKKDYKTLITKRALSNEEISLHLQMLWDPSYSRYQDTLQDITQRFGVECLRQTKEDMLYTVHMTEQGALLISFFFSEGDQRESWTYDRAFVVDKKRSAADFSVVQSGSSIDEVQAVDPAVDLWRMDPEKHSSDSFSSLHYLIDGLLQIDYVKDAQGDYTVSNLTHYADFRISWNVGGTTVYHDYSILPQDYPA